MAKKRTGSSRKETNRPARKKGGRRQARKSSALSNWDVAPAFELQAKYGLFAENRPAMPALDPARVPEEFRPLIPVAERWNVGDDIMRQDLVERTSKQILRADRRRVRPYENDIIDWLGGPESRRRVPSLEYLAFSYMMMALFDGM